MNAPQEFVVDENEFDLTRFNLFHLGKTPQIYEAKRVTNFGKINTKTVNNRLDNVDIKCPFCRTMMCEVSKKENDEDTKRFCSKVRGYEQLCHECGKELCETFGREYKTTCHHYIPGTGVHRSGIYVKKFVMKVISKSSKFMGCKAKGKDKCKMMCKALKEILQWKCI